MVTEPLKPFFDCMLVDLATGMYCNQTSRGEVVGGISGKHHERTLSWDASLDFMLEYAKTLTTLVPRLKPVNALRQWAGSYDVTEDAKPILERHASPDGFITAAGFSGHGFMTHPMTNLIVASLVLNEKPPMDIRPFRASRFAEGDLRKEGLVIG
jgi:sarcosine oxidase subunit beta